LVAAMVVAFFLFGQSGGAAPQAVADKQPAHSSASPKIIGGKPVPNGKYPFTAALLDKRRPGGAFQQQFCAGTLIDQDSVLTAAHCFFTPRGDFTSGVELVVVVGLTDLNQNQGQIRQVRPTNIFIHPRYNNRTVVYDAAVLNLERAVTGIQPIKLATASQNNLESPGHILRAAGWGTMIDGPQPIYPHRMREVSLPVVSDSSAEKVYDALYGPSGYVPPIMVAAAKKGKDTCWGDSGGPLFDSGSRTQVGITSYGERCGSARYPGIYTEVNNLGIRNFILGAARR
jgi:secreted trypsin-like serine protease